MEKIVPEALSLLQVPAPRLSGRLGVLCFYVLSETIRVWTDYSGLNLYATDKGWGDLHSRASDLYRQTLGYWKMDDRHWIIVVNYCRVLVRNSFFILGEHRPFPSAVSPFRYYKRNIFSLWMVRGLPKKHYVRGSATQGRETYLWVANGLAF